MRDVFRLLKLTLREKKRLVVFFICTLFVSAFTYLFVNLIQPILDRMFHLAPGGSIPQKTRLMDWIFQHFHITEEQYIAVIPILLVIVIFGKGLFTFLSSYSMKSIGHKAVRKLRNELFEHLLYQPTQYYDHVSTGDIMSRMTSDVDKIQQAVSGSMGDLIQEIFILIALLIYIFITDWRLALVSFIIAPLAAIPLAVFSKQLKKKGRQSQIRMSEIYSLLYETITGNKIVKAFTMERFELKRFFEATKKYFKTSLELAWVGSLSSPFMEFLGGVVGAFILFVGSTRIAQGYISPGDFGSFVAAIFYAYTPIKRLSRANNVIQQGVASHERILEIMRTESQIKEYARDRVLPPVKGHVRFEGINFSYDQSQSVLHDISFEIQPTESVAFVGLSGSGKTTIVNLLSRFYNPDSGRILIDGNDISEVNISSLRSQIGLVTQELILFNDSIRNNIAYGLKDMPQEEVEAAARIAEAHDFIERMPLGYDTQIGEGGVLLSSGQRQRLSIARAVLKDPPILILDEATSALDSESERLIQIALNRVMKNRTTFIIAHRLSTIRNADMILVIDKGKIIEAGTHRQLCRRDGVYKKLYALQFPDEKETLT